MAQTVRRFLFICFVHGVGIKSKKYLVLLVLAPIYILSKHVTASPPRDRPYVVFQQGAPESFIPANALRVGLDRTVPTTHRESLVATVVATPFTA